MSGRRQNTNHRQKVRQERFSDRKDWTRNLQVVAEELVGTSMAVRLDGRDYRIECGLCAWSERNATVSEALTHRATH